MEEHSHNGASPGPDLVEASPLEQQKPGAKITRKMPSIPAASSSVKPEVQQGETKRISYRSVYSDFNKYRGWSWPKVVGLKVDKAKRIIRKGKPELHFEVLSKDAMQTCDGRSMRVRLIVDKYNRVVKTRHVG
ncbi:uncharacterized protein [Lolium perenne]|uniref:uncharacterized protein n=1 Tax=Lolium perenne TaxID=4522 RepID=UPI0021F59A6A|nr:uncharacterized protein LOC127327680 isoform X2 [Lolium perenne]